MPLKVGSMMWPRKLLDIGWTDLAFGGLQCIFPRENRAQIRKLEEKCGGYDQAMICLSVRTGFDLLLQALRLPAGSEVIMSAITIPDMIAIVRRHGLVPVPLDLEFNTLAPTPRALQSAITTKTRLIVVAHLFGVCVPMAPIVEVAKEHDLFVVEDCINHLKDGKRLVARNSRTRRRMRVFIALDRSRQQRRLEVQSSRSATLEF